MALPPRNHDEGPPFPVRPFVEFAIVFGTSLYFIFYLIPSQTSDGENFGLSPRMVPVVCSVLIAGLATVSLLVSLLGKPKAQPLSSSDGIATVILLICASLVGVTIVHWFGLISGGVVLVVLASCVIGERRLMHVTILGAAAGLLLLAVQWSGL